MFADSFKRNNDSICKSMTISGWKVNMKLKSQAGEIGQRIVL